MQMETEKMYKVLTETPINQYVQPISQPITLGGANPFKMVTCESESSFKKDDDKSDKTDQVTSSS